MESTFDRATKMAQTQFTKMRWALGLNGLLSVVVGVVILAWPNISLEALTILFGAWALANGVIVLVVAASGPSGDRGWLILRGLLGIGVGVAVLVWPSISELALLYVIGAYAIALGIVAVIGAFSLPLDTTDSWLLGLSGLVSVLFGIAMFADPGAGALVVLSLIAAFALVTGVTEIVYAIGAKKMIKDDVQRAFNPNPKPQAST
jgi:uncharacterized membrane protein HdeD (DUF308 family)